MTKKETINLTEWRSKLDKLETEYRSINKLRDDAKEKLGEYFILMEYGEKNLIGLYPSGKVDEYEGDERLHTMRDVRWYYIMKTKLKLLDTEKMVGALVDKLKDKLSTEEILRDALYDTTPDDLKEMFERAIINKGKVREKGGCYKLCIGGKRGRPLELMVRN